MKRTKIYRIPYPMPKEIGDACYGAQLYDSSCSPEARVYFIDRDGGMYLKRGSKGTLFAEARMNTYFHSKGLGPEVLCYASEDADWLLTRRVGGEDCTDREFLQDPKRLAHILGEELRRLHELDSSDCPIQNRMQSYFSTVTKNYQDRIFDPAYYAYGNAISADEAYSIVDVGKASLDSRVLLHGDYCLPNIMLKDWRLQGFIDLGGGGVGDRHIDLYWGAWTLKFNTGTDQYRDIFFGAYGRELVEDDKLRVIGAAECFG